MKKGLIALLFLSLFTSPLFAEVRLPRLISDGMVLQRNSPITIWGWAAAGEPVTVFFNGQSFQTSTTADGKWKVVVPAQKEGGPFDMRIKGENEIIVHDILIGDVWLCSGQSNMEQAMSGRLVYRYAAEIANADFDFIRQFLIPDNYDFNKQWEDMPSGNWRAAKAPYFQDFTAVGYFFAKALYQQYKVPVGIINAALGGSPAEAWISESALRTFPEAWKEMQQFKDTAFVAALEKREQQASREWNNKLLQFDKGQSENWNQTPANGDWKPFIVPGDWNQTMAGMLPGVVWCKKEFSVQASMAGKPAKLEMGRLVDADSVFINGIFVGNTTYQYPARRYELPPTVLQVGSNEITVRLVCNGRNGGFVPDKLYQLTTAADTVDLKGQWLYRVGATATQPSPPSTAVRWKPGGLYNAMIAPLKNFAIKGAVWYQGESNAGAYAQYGAVMKSLISDWRQTFRQEALPFLFVQLPNYMEPSDSVQARSDWAGLRQQQLNLLQVSNTAMAVTIDLGEWNDIHPENKKDVGGRLALLARKYVYEEKKVLADGPTIERAVRKGNTIVLHFQSTGSGLMFQGNLPPHFFVQNNKFEYARATAVITSKTIVLKGIDTATAKKVMYSYANNPAGGMLYNREGLPASPFQIEVQ